MTGDSRRWRPMHLRGRSLQWGRRTYVMAILNLSPDSFSGDGLGTDLDALAARTRAALAAGCDLLDVGAESSRPGSQPVAAERELELLLPALARIRSLTDLPISVDTYKAAVAARALDCGADLINDISALQADPAMAALAADRACPVILMHREQTAVREAALGRHFAGIDCDDIVTAVGEGLSRRVDAAVAAGIDRSRIIVDPGIGFGKDPQQNLELLDRLGEIRSTLGRPVLIGASRKSVIGHAGAVGGSDRISGTVAAHALAIANGADVVRVHDFAAGVQGARVADAIARRRDL